MVTRRQGSETLKFGIKQVDMGEKFSRRIDMQVDVSSVSPLSERSKLDASNDMYILGTNRFPEGFELGTTLS